MRVGDILSITSDSTNIVLYSVYSDEIVSYYDGKNSIGEIYNDREVIGLRTEDNTIIIDIY